jgi:hypothetical protein
MRWLILLMTSAVLGACAGSIGPQANPIGSPPPREPTKTDRIEPEPTAAPLIAPTSAPGFRADLPDLGEAPELNNEIWLNIDRPLRLSDLRGQVVLLDMWTFG